MEFSLWWAFCGAVLFCFIDWRLYAMYLAWHERFKLRVLIVPAICGATLGGLLGGIGG